MTVPSPHCLQEHVSSWAATDLFQELQPCQLELPIGFPVVILVCSSLRVRLAPLGTLRVREWFQLLMVQGGCPNSHAQIPDTELMNRMFWQGRLPGETPQHSVIEIHHPLGQGRGSWGPEDVK